MSEAHPQISLTDVAWLTALARTLTRDEAAADDLVQETWVAAQTSPPRGGELTRPWLATVLRRFHLQSLRSTRRRLHRSRSAAKHEALPDTSELVERTELQRTLADCLLSLDEPFRTTLMLVSFEGVSTGELAERDGVSASVVRYRVRRAREMMREKLMATNGEDWSQWRAALLPLAALPVPGEAGAVPAAASTHVASKGALVGAAAMNLKLIAFVATLAAIIASLFLVKPGPLEGLPSGERVVRYTSDSTASSEAEPHLASAGHGRGRGELPAPAEEEVVDAASSSEPEDSATAVMDPEFATLEMRIRSPRGGWSAAVMAEEALFLDGMRPSWNAASIEDDVLRQMIGSRGRGRAICAHSERNADGVFRWLDVRPGIPLSVAALDDTLFPVEAVEVPALMPGEVRVVEVVVLASLRTLDLRVVAPDGSPVPAAGVRISREDATGAVSGRTDPDGRFSRGGVGSEVVTVRVKADGHATWIDRAVRVAESPIEVQLEAGRTVQVEVRTPALEPVPGARIVCKPIGAGRSLRFIEPVRTDAAGACSLEGLPMREVPIEITVEGHLFSGRLEAGAVTHTVEVPASQGLEVLILGAPPAEGPGRHRVRLRPLQPLVGDERLVERASAPGRYVASGLFPGRYEVRLEREHRGTVLWSSAAIEVAVTPDRPGQVTLEL